MNRYWHYYLPAGDVNLDDFTQFRNGFEGGAAATWLHGDYDYTGSVNVQDFDLLLNGLRGQGYVSSDLMAALGTFVNEHQLNVDLSTVPEPAGIVSIIAGASAFGLRRRRR